MLFNSIEFFIFLPIVFTLYWLLARLPLVYQNSLLLISSYVFYGWWDYRFLSLIFLSTLVDFCVGRQIAKAPIKSQKKKWLWVSILFNLGLLGFFKYYNFFIESWVSAFAGIGVTVDPWTISLVLPVGISFYTFQTLSYSLDIYKGQLEPASKFIDFAAFVAFFPQLVAGPIERASQLLPQISGKRKFNSDQAINGLELILWGLFKKVVIADSMAIIVNDIFDNSQNLHSYSLIIGAIAFSFQIYGDFSGYSDIAIGTAKLFGVELMKNFDYPYLSRNMGEFWRRWHISLSSWFRDYLYIPLGGSKGTEYESLRNISIIFLVSGLWHGANWTFVLWGAIHAILFIPLFIFNNNRKFRGPFPQNTKLLPLFVECCHVALTFLIVTLTWIIFRSESIEQLQLYLLGIISNLDEPFYKINNNEVLKNICIFGSYFTLSILLLRQRAENAKFNIVKSLAFSAILLCLISLFGQFSEKTFIYFQF